jgi:hypothetical protein
MHNGDEIPKGTKVLGWKIVKDRNGDPTPKLWVDYKGKKKDYSKVPFQIPMQSVKYYFGTTLPDKGRWGVTEEIDARIADIDALVEEAEEQLGEMKPPVGTFIPGPSKPRKISPIAKRAADEAKLAAMVAAVIKENFQYAEKVLRSDVTNKQPAEEALKKIVKISAQLHGLVGRSASLSAGSMFWKK